MARLGTPSNEEAISVALDVAAEGHRAGLDRSLGGVTGTVAAEAHLRARLETVRQEADSRAEHLPDRDTFAHR
jgi:hypothetical protein